MVLAAPHVPSYRVNLDAHSAARANREQVSNQLWKRNMESFQLVVKGAPKLVVSRLLREPSGYDPSYEYHFRYRKKNHQELPHVVKFSGGRSSGMLLFTLLENHVLDARRGDVILFNNTAAEHPATYEFVAKCKDLAESRYGIPFFLIEYQTYEDVRNGEWTRLGTYRLANAKPLSEGNPYGYSHRGEPFEELLSWSGYVPNQFRRICTRTLKLEVTRMFLRDWLACKEGIPHLGHWEETPQIEGETLYRRHLRNKGGVPKDIYLAKKAFVMSRPVYRPEQCYKDFSAAPVAINNPLLSGKSFGGNTVFGPGGVEYVAFIGLRGDEEARVQRVAARISGDPEAQQGYEGEHIYMPLADMRVKNDDVNMFWQQNLELELQLPPSGYLSNCVYCFLKGTLNLAKVHESICRGSDVSKEERNTPLDIDWWARVEENYTRDLDAEGRGSGFVGFFGLDEQLTYRGIAERGAEALGETVAMLPCDCTD